MEVVILCHTRAPRGCFLISPSKFASLWPERPPRQARWWVECTHSRRASGSGRPFVSTVVIRHSCAAVPDKRPLPARVDVFVLVIKE